MSYREYPFRRRVAHVFTIMDLLAHEVTGGG
jgi:hypothetical protein